MIVKSMPPPVNASKCPVENNKPAQPRRVIPVRQLECSGSCMGPNEKRTLPIKQRARSADRANCNQTAAVSRPMGQAENGRAFDLRDLTQNRCRSDFQLHSPQQNGQDMQYQTTSGVLNGFESAYNSGYTETPQRRGCCERDNPYEVNGQPTRNYNARNAFPDNRDRSAMDSNTYQRTNNEMPTIRSGNFQVRCLDDTADEVYQDADPDMRNYRFGNVRPFNVNATKSRPMDVGPEPTASKGANRCCQNGEQSYEANFARGQPLSSTMAYPRAEVPQCDSDFDRTQQQSLASAAMTNRNRAPQMTSANDYSRAKVPQCDSDFDRTQQPSAAMANRNNRPPFAIYYDSTADESRRARPPFGIYEDSTLDQTQQNPTFNVYCDSTMNGNQTTSNATGRRRPQEPSSYAQQYQMSEPTMQRLRNLEPVRSIQQTQKITFEDPCKKSNFTDIEEKSVQNFGNTQIESYNRMFETHCSRSYEDLDVKNSDCDDLLQNSEENTQDTQDCENTQNEKPKFCYDDEDDDKTLLNDSYANQQLNASNTTFDPSLRKCCASSKTLCVQECDTPLLRLQFETLAKDTYCPGLIQDSVDNIELFNDHAYEIVFSGPNAANIELPMDDPMTLIEAFHLRIENDRSNMNKTILQGLRRRPKSEQSFFNISDVNFYYAQQNGTELNEAIANLFKAEKLYEQEKQDAVEIDFDIDKTTFQLPDNPIEVTTYIGCTKPKYRQPEPEPEPELEPEPPRQRPSRRCGKCF